MHADLSVSTIAFTVKIHGCNGVMSLLPLQFRQLFMLKRLLAVTQTSRSAFIVLIVLEADTLISRKTVAGWGSSKERPSIPRHGLVLSCFVSFVRAQQAS